MKRYLAGLAVSIALLNLQLGSAAAADLTGMWVGSGTVSPPNGNPERVRCRVNYAPISSKVVNVSATCASASTTLHQTGQVLKVSENRYVGDFFNSQLKISGRVRVIITGRSQTVTLRSSNASGHLKLTRR